MSITNAERRRLAKKKANERKNRKAKNLRNNVGEKRFRLDVDVNNNGLFEEGLRWFRSNQTVEKYIGEIEASRKQGAKILPGRVVSLVTGQIVANIAGSGKEKVKGELPDTIANGPKADQNVTAKAEEKPVSLEVAAEKSDTP